MPCLAAKQLHASLSARRQLAGRRCRLFHPAARCRDVWIFGDTLYGKSRSILLGGDPLMVRNSIGNFVLRQARQSDARSCDPRDANGDAKDFFAAQHPHTWYWAMDGFFSNKSLWVTLLCIRDAPKTSSLSLGFETCGADLAKVSGWAAMRKNGRSSTSHW